MTNQPHARAFDLPGWPCPPRVRDIPTTEHSWGFIDVGEYSNHAYMHVAQDELGYLWVNGDTVPRYAVPNSEHANPGGVALWTVDGIGLYVHPKSLRNLPSISRLDMEPDRWLPVTTVLAELPEWVKTA